MTKLKEMRTRRGITQAQLADACGLSIRAVQDYEQMHKDINKAAAITVYKLAKALYCRIEDIIEIDTAPKRKGDGMKQTYHCNRRVMRLALIFDMVNGAYDILTDGNGKYFFKEDNGTDEVQMIDATTDEEAYALVSAFEVL